MKTFDRRWLLGGGAALAAGAGVGAWRSTRPSIPGEIGVPAILRQQGAMPYRAFGSTGLEVSELSFGAWAIGGASYGAVDRAEALSALARAEALGCNLVDTAGVYGDSEQVLGEFLRGRRDRWLVSTKYSGQKPGMTATLESQLRMLGSDHVDFYMVHWVPSDEEAGLLDELASLKRAGKVRFTGLSVYSIGDVDRLLDATGVDGLMLPFSLLDPDPFLARRARLAASGKAIMIRSALKEGFLTGKFTRDTRFTDPRDQRSKWPAERIAATVAQVETLRFLEAEHGSLARAAIAYPLSFPEVSTTVVGVKSPAQAQMNFGDCAGARLSATTLARVHALQDELDLRQPDGLLARLLARLTRRS
jgi:aryl-alcohol dehydrogenase-like predicted oxidoreductase